MKPVISIVVPAYNSAPYVGALLDSMLAQTEERWECIFVDDGSDDDTFDRARAHAPDDRRIRIYRTVNGGPCHARNQGYLRSSPDAAYVTFMDSDDMWLPDALQTLRERIEAHPEAIGSHGLADFVDRDGRPYRPGEHVAFGRNRTGYDGHRLVDWPLEAPTTFDVLINGNALFPPGLLLARRGAYELAGPFDESLFGAADWEMLIRLSRFGPLEFVNRVLLHYRRHDANIGAQLSVPVEAWLVRCIGFYSTANTPEQRTAARRGWRAYQIRLTGDRLRDARVALRHGRLDDAARSLARPPVYAWRYIRGYPRPREVRTPPKWADIVDGIVE